MGFFCYNIKMIIVKTKLASFAKPKRLIFQSTGGPSPEQVEFGPPSPHDAFTEKNKEVKDFLTKVEKDYPHLNSQVQKAREKAQIISKKAEDAKKNNDQSTLSQQVVELQKILQEFEGPYLSYEVKKASGIYVTKLNDILREPNRDQKISPINLLFTSALFIPDNFKSLTYLNGAMNNFRLVSDRVHTITDPNQKTRTFIKIALPTGQIGFMEMKYFKVDGTDTKTPSEDKTTKPAASKETGTNKTSPEGEKDSKSMDPQFETLLKSNNLDKIKKYFADITKSKLDAIKKSLQDKGEKITIEKLLGPLETEMNQDSHMVRLAEYTNQTENPDLLKLVVKDSVRTSKEWCTENFPKEYEEYLQKVKKEEKEETVKT